MNVEINNRGRAHIVDNRDNTREDVSALGCTVWEARATAFLNAVDEARTRNEREGWPRFVALRWRTLA
jgi:hypothetical protein